MNRFGVRLEADDYNHPRSGYLTSSLLLINYNLKKSVAEYLQRTFSFYTVADEVGKALGGGGLRYAQ